MHLKLSKNGRISSWEIRIISGVSFMLTTMLVYLLIQLSDPEGYRLGRYVTLSCNLSAAIVGGYFGPGIFRTISEEKYLIKLLKLVFIILICETIVIAFPLAISNLFLGVSFMSAFDIFIGMFALLLILYGKWKIVQITITVFILFLGFRYIRARELRE